MKWSIGAQPLSHTPGAGGLNVIYGFTLSALLSILLFLDILGWVRWELSSSRAGGAHTVTERSSKDGLY